MCPRTRSILVAMAMLLVSLFAAALIAHWARIAPVRAREKAAVALPGRTHRPNFSQSALPGLPDQRLLSATSLH